jgi:hypothetical protein
VIKNKIITLGKKLNSSIEYIPLSFIIPILEQYSLYKKNNIMWVYDIFKDQLKINFKVLFEIYIKIYLYTHKENIETILNFKKNHKNDEDNEGVEEFDYNDKNNDKFRIKNFDNENNDLEYFNNIKYEFKFNENFKERIFFVLFNLLNKWNELIVSGNAPSNDLKSFPKNFDHIHNYFIQKRSNYSDHFIDNNSLDLENIDQ